MENNKKRQLKIALLGHVNAGKSTVAGHLVLYRSTIGTHWIARVEKEASEAGKLPSTFYMNDRRYIDEYPPKFITFTSVFTFTEPSNLHNIKFNIETSDNADCAMLVVSAAREEFEIAFNETFFDQAFFTLTLGAKKIIVVINKMDLDTVQYSQQRFEEIKHSIFGYFSGLGYTSEDITYVPVSGLTGENVIERSDNFWWYNGPTLFEAFDNLTEIQQFNNLPLRMPIQDVYKIGGIGTVVVGRIETGVLTVGDIITVAPNLTTEVKSIEIDYEQVAEALAGNTASINLRNVRATDLHRGFVIGRTNHQPPAEAFDFVAHIIVLNAPDEIRVGYAPKVVCHASHVTCIFTELMAKYDKRTGDQIESAPVITALKKGDFALVRLEPTQPMMVESFSEYPPLGRFTVHDGYQTVAVGIIRSVNKKI